MNAHIHHLPRRQNNPLATGTREKSSLKQQKTSLSWSFQKARLLPLLFDEPTLPVFANEVEARLGSGVEEIMLSTADRSTSSSSRKAAKRCRCRSGWHTSMVPRSSTVLIGCRRMFMGRITKAIPRSSRASMVDIVVRLKVAMLDASKQSSNGFLIDRIDRCWRCRNKNNICRWLSLQESRIYTFFLLLAAPFLRGGSAIGTYLPIHLIQY
jgi:hypothetical protein